VRYLEESWAVKKETEGKECGCLAEARLGSGGAQATLRAASCLLYLQ